MSEHTTEIDLNVCPECGRRIDRVSGEPTWVDPVSKQRHHDPCPEPATTTWRYRTWGGSTATVVADRVEFTSTHVVWRDCEGSVVLAERPENVNELAQVGTLGSSTRGVRPAAEVV